MAQFPDSLDKFSWSSRLILIKALPAEIEPLQQQLQKNSAQIDERDILWFILSDQQVLSNYRGNISQTFYMDIMSDWFSESNSPMEVVLIGKDGSEKWRNQILDLSTIFGKIDLMPMRQYEMMRN